MDEPCSRLSFTLESLKELRILTKRLQHHFERDLTVEHLVAGKEHASHAAMAKFPFHDEPAEFTRRIQYSLFIVAHWFSPENLF